MERAWRGCGGAPMWVVQLADIVQLTKAMMRPPSVSFRPPASPNGNVSSEKLFRESALLGAIWQKERIKILASGNVARIRRCGAAGFHVLNLQHSIGPCPPRQK